MQDLEELNLEEIKNLLSRDFASLNRITALSLIARCESAEKELEREKLNVQLCRKVALTSNEECRSAWSRIELLESELKELREQKPIRFMICDSRIGSEDLSEHAPEYYESGVTVIPLYTAPVAKSQASADVLSLERLKFVGLELIAAKDQRDKALDELKELREQAVANELNGNDECHDYGWMGGWNAGLRGDDKAMQEVKARRLARSKKVAQSQDSAELTHNMEWNTAAIMQFVGDIVGAYSSNFITTPILTIGQLYQVARNHVKDNYGIETKSLAEEVGEEFAKKCNPPQSNANAHSEPFPFIPWSKEAEFFEGAAKSQQSPAVVVPDSVDYKFIEECLMAYSSYITSEYPELAKKINSQITLLSAPQASAEQASDMVLVRKDVVNFLNGAGELEGSYFGDFGTTNYTADLAKGMYWWRKYLPKVAQDEGKV